MANIKAGAKPATDYDTATLIPNCGSLEGSSRVTKAIRFKDGDEVIEITLDVQRDAVPVQGVRRVATEAAVATAMKRYDRSKSTTAVALKGLQFVREKVGSGGWAAVEKRFNHLQVDDVLLRSRFGKCIGNLSSLFQCYDGASARIILLKTCFSAIKYWELILSFKNSRSHWKKL